MTPPSSVRSSPTATPGTCLYTFVNFILTFISDFEYEEDRNGDAVAVTPDNDQPTPPPDYSSPEPDHDHDVDYLQLTRDLERSVEESEAECENGFCFPQPPSPTFFTEAPTPEFIGKTFCYVVCNSHSIQPS